MKIESKISSTKNSKTILDLVQKQDPVIHATKENIQSSILGVLNFDEYILDQDNQQKAKISVYNRHILKLLDDLNCPLLLLPRLKSGNSIHKIAFFSDIRFTGIATMIMIVKIAKSFQAGLTLFNFADPAIPEMDDEFAKNLFRKNGMSNINGLELGLVNINKSISIPKLQSILDHHEIDLIAALNSRKDLLYQFD